MSTALKFAQKAIVLNADRKILFLKRTAHEEGEAPVWDLPGGGLEFGEAPEQGLRRELQEEVGLTVGRIVPLKVWSFCPNALKQVVGVTYLVEDPQGEIKLSHEHNAYEWMDPHQALFNKEIEVFHADIMALVDYLS